VASASAEAFLRGMRDAAEERLYSRTAHADDVAYP
jgi:hypothetical protein